MKVRNVKLEWNVLNYDFNKKKIVDFDIFSTRHADYFFEKLYKAEIKNMNELKEFIDDWARCYWCRIEYEILAGDVSYPLKEENFEKLDVYRQIHMNLDKIAEYVAKELKIFKEE